MIPTYVHDILERAKNSSRVGDHEATEHLLKNYLAKVPDSREARLLLGTTFAKESKLTEAADEFINLLARDPGDTEALNNAAVIFRRQGKFQEALSYLKDAIDVDPTKAEFHYNIGNIHKQLGNNKEASVAYSKVIDLDPGFVPAYNNLGTIYEQLREYNKAYGVFRKGLALDSNNPTLHFNYGVALEASGRLEEAANEYRAALRSKPGWPDPINNLGIVLFKQGRHEKAMATFNRVLAMDPFNAEAHNNMGVVLADQGRTQEAIKNYRQAIEVNPRYIKAVINLERALEASGDFADALIELEKLVKLSPDNASIRNRLAGLYLKMERYPEALEQAEAALQWEPDNIQALRVQGAAQRIMGNDAAAQTCFEKILSLDPGNYSFLMDLADIHFRRKEHKEAEERIQSYLIRRPNDRAAKMLLGRLYAEMGNRTHAIQVFEELSKADPNDAEALAAVAELHKEAGSIEKALRTADNLVNLQGKRGTADDLLDLNKSLEFYENAVNAYSTSAKDMWAKNVKLMDSEDEDDSMEEDISFLMGASHTIDEETEELFVEETEDFLKEEEEEDSIELILGNESYGDIPEETQPRYRDPLDALREGAEEPPFPEEYPPDDEAPLPAPPAAQPSDEAIDMTPPVEPPAPQVPPPDYPQYPAYPPPHEPNRSPPVKPEAPPPMPPEPEPVAEEMFPEEEILPEEEIPAAPEPAEELHEDSPPEYGEELLPADELVLSEELPGGIFGPETETPGELLDLETPMELSAEEPSAFENTPDEEIAAAEGDWAAKPVNEISEVIELLDCLKKMTSALPERERNFYLEGKYSAALESVIGGLKDLTTSGDIHGSRF